MQRVLASSGNKVEQHLTSAAIVMNSEHTVSKMEQK